MTHMISSTTTIQVVLATAITTNQLPCTASWMDQGGLGNDNTANTNSTTAVTLVPAPASGTERLVVGLSICNTDSAPATVTINKVVGGTPSQWAKFVLPVGYRASYDNQWRVMDPNGNFCETVTITSGTLTANQGTAAALSSAWPVEVTDGTNVLGTSSHPMRIDPVGTTAQPVTGTFWQTTQPVSGTVTANAGTGTFAENVSQWGGSATTLGQKASASSVPVVLASDQSEISAVPSKITSVSSERFFSSGSITGLGATGTSILRMLKVDIVSATFSSSSAIVLTVLDGSGALVITIAFFLGTNATTSFNYFFSDSLNLPANNSSAGYTITLSNALLAGVIGIQVGSSN
jgi:hypothetical protein